MGGVGAADAMERPPPSATLPPLRERLYTPASQRRLLQDQLLGVAFYRHIISEDEKVLLKVLESEFDTLISKAASLKDDGVYALRFPPLVGSAHFLIRRICERYHLQTAVFGEEEERFIAVYLHPRDAMAPVLRLDDFRHGQSYYTAPPPPPAQYEQQHKFQRRQNDEGYSLDAEELPLTRDYAEWARATASASARTADDGSRGGGGYECEIAGCHEHILELRPSGTSPTHMGEADVTRLEAIMEAIMNSGAAGLRALRRLPAGCAGVFESADAARRFINAHRAERAANDRAGSDATDGFVLLRIGAPTSDDGEGPTVAADAPVACEARPLSALQRRRAVGGGAAGALGRGGAPRALQAALRGMGGGSRARAGQSRGGR